MTAADLWSFIALVGMLAAFFLAAFHIRRAFREKGERETRDIALGCTMAFAGLVGPVGTGLLDLPLPIWLGWLLAAGAVVLFGAAVTRFGDNAEVGAPKNRRLTERQRIFALHDDMPYNIAALIAVMANLLVFFI
jgi:predicted permease